MYRFDKTKFIIYHEMVVLEVKCTIKCCYIIVLNVML